MQVLITALEFGIIFSIMSVGIFITFKILNLPDLTIDGSHTLGVAVAAVLTVMGHPYIGILCGFIAGMLAGCVTGILYTKLKINPILSGILVMNALYSINLRIMDKPNISILGNKNIYTIFEGILPDNYLRLIVNVCIILIISVLVYAFLRTQIGASMIATGDNEEMVRASSINSDRMKILGLALGNGLVALSGAIMVSYTGFADVNGGTGMMVIGIASIIVGEAIFGKKNLVICFVGVVLGAVIYRIILAIAIDIGLRAGDLKLLSTVLIIIAIGLPSITKYIRRKKEDA